MGARGRICDISQQCRVLARASLYGCQYIQKGEIRRKVQLVLYHLVLSPSTVHLHPAQKYPCLRPFISPLGEPVARYMYVMQSSCRDLYH